MPTAICSRPRCRRLNIWPAGSRHDDPAPLGARSRSWCCWYCNSRLRKRRKEDVPHGAIPRSARSRQLSFAFAAVAAMLLGVLGCAPAPDPALLPAGRSWQCCNDTGDTMCFRECVACSSGCVPMIESWCWTDGYFGYGCYRSYDLCEQSKLNVVGAERFSQCAQEP